MSVKKYLVLASLGLLVSGCGGGSGSSSAPAPTELAFTNGDLQGRAAISNPPVTTSNAFCVATAFTGTFSSLKLRELNPPLGETRIFYDSVGLTPQDNLYNMAIDGSDAQHIASTATFDTEPYVMQNGKVLFASARNGINALYEMNQDGSNLVSVASSSGNIDKPSADAAGDKITYISGGLAYILDMTTGTPTQVPAPNVGDTVDYCVITPDGSTIFLATDNGSNHWLYREKTNLSGLVGFVNLTAFPEGMAMAPDGSEFVVAYAGTLDRFSTTFLSDVKVPVATGGFFGVTYSPDQKLLAYAYSPGQAMPSRIATIPIDGGSPNVITPSLIECENPSWTPFVKDRTLIASGGGMLGTRACGVIYGQQVNRSTSVLAFDVTTPSSVVMTAQTPANGTQPNLVFSIDADSITKLAYANGYAWRGIRAIGSGTPVTSANGALVSLNGLDGTVISVLPFMGTRAAGSRPTFSDSGSVRTFSGSFLGVYDKDGKNLAPGGASVVKLDTKTGAISVQG